MTPARGPHPLAAWLQAAWSSAALAGQAAARLPATGPEWHPELAARAANLRPPGRARAQERFVAEVERQLLARLDAMHRGVRAYQEHPYHRAMRELPVAARSGAARLLDYGGGGQPVVFVPSLVNPGWVLDLEPRLSLLRWLARQGLRPLLVDWGAPGAAEAGFDLDAYVAKPLQALIASLGGPVPVVGYCLGGTLALALAALAPSLISRLALLATPWDFAGYPPAARQGLLALWAAWQPATRAMGALPMEAIQTGFAALDPLLAARKFEAFSRLRADGPAARRFVALEDWANSGPPLVAGAARQSFERLFAANESGQGHWRIGDAVIRPESVRQPSLVVISQSDRLVPPAASEPLAASLPHARALRVGSGHVGMIVGSRARGQLWQPLADWLNG